MTDYGLPHKVVYVVFGYLGQGLSLNPLGEVVYHYDDEFNLSPPLGEENNYVYSLLGKWPKIGNLSQFFCRLFGLIDESLALVTSP